MTDLSAPSRATPHVHRMAQSTFSQGDAGLSVSLDDTSLRINGLGELELFRGPRGDKGDTGDSGTPANIQFPGYQSYPASSLETVVEKLIRRSRVSIQTTTPVGQYRVVKWLPNAGFEYVSASVLSDRLKAVGLTLSAGVAGDWIDLQRVGLLDMSQANWTPELPLFLGEDGLLTQTVPSRPSSIFSMRVGSALSPTLVALDVGDAIGLA